MTDAVIWIMALAGAVAVFLVAAVLAWACIQEFKDE